MYYVGRNGRQTGPHSLDELKAMAAAGQLAPTDLTWTDGMSEWKPASVTLPDLFANLPTPPPAAPAPGPPPILAQTTTAPLADATLVSGTPITTYLWQSIVVTLLCCLPVGVVAIVFASQVDSKRQHGDIAGAMASSKKAKTWCWVAFAIGMVQWVLSIVYGVFMVFAATRHHSY